MEMNSETVVYALNQLVEQQKETNTKLDKLVENGSNFRERLGILEEKTNAIEKKEEGRTKFFWAVSAGIVILIVESIVFGSMYFAG